MTLQDNPLYFNDVPPRRKTRGSTRMSVARLAEMLNDRIGDLAVALLGSPNRELSSQQQLRFGAKGSVAVEIAGTRNNIRVEGLGAGKKNRGRRHGAYRPDLLSLDDIENDEAVRSPEQRQKLWNWIHRAALKVGPPDGSMDVVWVGTVLHFDAVIVRAAKAPAWNVTNFQAVIQFPDRMDLWDRLEEADHNDREDAARTLYVAHQADMDAGAVVNWPSVQPLVFLMLERPADAAAFQTEYQNTPISEGNPFGEQTYWEQPQRDWVFFGAIDPSLGKTGTGSSAPPSRPIRMRI